MGNISSRRQQTPSSRSKLFGSVEVPEPLVCSLCWELYQDPVTTRCGHTYCRSCLHAWMRKQPECPLDRCRIHRRELISNKVLRKVCAEIMSSVELLHAPTPDSLKNISPVAYQFKDKEGLDLQISNLLVNTPTVHLICPLHDGILVDPVLTHCGHTACRVCMQIQTHKTHGRCYCGKRVHENGLLSNRPLDDFTQGAQLRCRFSLKRCHDTGKLALDERGCPELVTLKERAKHESVCIFAYAVCPINEQCRFIRKKELDQHLEEHHGSAQVKTSRSKHEGWKSLFFPRLRIREDERHADKPIVLKGDDTADGTEVASGSGEGVSQPVIDKTPSDPEVNSLADPKQQPVPSSVDLDDANESDSSSESYKSMPPSPRVVQHSILTVQDSPAVMDSARSHEPLCQNDDSAANVTNSMIHDESAVHPNEPTLVMDQCAKGENRMEENENESMSDTESLSESRNCEHATQGCVVESNEDGPQFHSYADQDVQNSNHGSSSSTKQDLSVASDQEEESDE
eukprot:TRINITY_DN7806_c0_g2_i1.p1 TRINITY_DN7806_c0_g2~~TRINITY_DN7806_c0_g2_i1.p1  ORF type:complete len:514 (+),score=88.87 TRINITY_DN7806_c0_g2_i1:48-1589(+)